MGREAAFADGIADTISICFSWDFQNRRTAGKSWRDMQRKRTSTKILPETSGHYQSTNVPRYNGHTKGRSENPKVC